MTNKEAWNLIVDMYRKNINSKEEMIQLSWEMLFSAVFGYPEGNVVAQYQVQMGVATKRADIVIKNDRKHLFVVELKRHTLHEGQAQLFSYPNQLKIDLGILVCDKLYIYDYDYTSSENNFSSVEIPFKQDNFDGESFVELFSKVNFDRQKIRTFIREYNDRKTAESKIKHELDDALLRKLLKEHFSENYPPEIVEKVLSDYNVSISPKSTPITAVPLAVSKTSSPVFGRNPIPGGTKDATQYNLNGTFTGGKGPTVHATVSYYVENHKGITYEQLKEAFPDECAKPGFGKMIRRVEEVSPAEWSGYRFNKHPIILASGQQVVVTNQWKPENMHSFIQNANRLGLDIQAVQ